MSEQNQQHLVALWRGINVGRAKRLAMADLRRVLEGLGGTEVHTLLNSGNAVFRAKPDAAQAWAERIHLAVAQQLGVEARVIVKTAAEWRTLAGAHGLGPAAQDPARLLVALTQEASTLQALAAWAQQDWGEDLVRLTPQAAYVYASAGVLASPAVAALNRALGDGVTTRNWATVQKILLLLG